MTQLAGHQERSLAIAQGLCQIQVELESCEVMECCLIDEESRRDLDINVHILRGCFFICNSPGRSGDDNNAFSAVC